MVYRISQVTGFFFPGVKNDFVITLFRAHMQCEFFFIFIA